MSQTSSRKNTIAGNAPSTGSIRHSMRHNDLDIEKTFHAMEKGHKVCKLMLLKKWDPTYKKLCYSRETRQLMLWKTEQGPKSCAKPTSLDLRSVKEVQTLDFKLNAMKIGDKWARDKEIKQFDPQKIFIITFGWGFVLNYWIFLFDTPEACRMWTQGIDYLISDTLNAPHPMVIERWLRKEFYILANPSSQLVAMKHMKPFVQTRLQYKVQSKILQDITEELMNFDAFASAYRRLVHVHALFSDHFAIYSDDGSKVDFSNFLRFLSDHQHGEMQSRERSTEFLRRYLREVDAMRDVTEPHLSVPEFCDYLFSRENTIMDPINDKIVHDMTRPLSHYWIASSHNTYLTGDQLKSESSLDAYARALLMGCRCIELDCWDGQKRGPNDFSEIVIYHGYTMTSKLNLKDVLYTIRQYAFVTSDYPVILSIEDNCSVPAQRLLAQEVREILGELLLTAPVSRDEIQLPSPAQLKKKIILKHKKLPIESEDIVVQQPDDFQDQDLLSKECVKRGMLYLFDSTKHIWTKHVFVLFADRLCYTLDTYDLEGQLEESMAIAANREEAASQMGDDDNVSRLEEEGNLSGFGVRPEEMHVTEEWFHGKIGRDVAKARLKEHESLGNGVFLVRESTTFIGDFSLSFLREGEVHHCRIKTRMVEGEKKYYFLETKQLDTLYELISYYTKHSLTTPHFRTHLVTPCPQPCPHVNQPWFAANIDKARAEELLNTVREDGAFLIRYSSTDENVFVLSLRVDGEFWHYRLKRDGRIFVVNQTVFENLNQIVDFYSTRDFVRGICLKFPVNEKNVGQYMSSELSVAASPGCYMELKDLDKEVQARAIRGYQATMDSELSFPANAVITVLRKEEYVWRGRYGTHTGWFPATFVVEFSAQDAIANADAANYGTIELAGSLIEKYDTDRAYALRICQAASHWSVQECIIAANSSEDMADWLNSLHEVTRSANDKIHILRTREKDLRIASELSNLVVYCQAVPFNPDYGTQGNFYEMCSFSETKHDKLLERGLCQFNMKQLSRVYPQASRLTSTNFNPLPMWNSACHMVALNYQTGDKAMQLNQGKFMANGKCGYVLKPLYMLDETYSPDNHKDITTSFPINLTIQILAGRHLSRKDKNKGICSPLVEVEIIGLPVDCQSFRTRAIASDGLHPIWNEHVEFTVLCPETALIRFYAEDGDFVGPKTDPFIGQAVYPLDCIRAGYRSVILRSQYSEELELSAILVHIDVRRYTPPTQSLSVIATASANATATTTTTPIATTTTTTAITTTDETNGTDQRVVNLHDAFQSGRTVYNPSLSAIQQKMSIVSMQHNNVREHHNSSGSSTSSPRLLSLDQGMAAGSVTKSRTISVGSRSHSMESTDSSSGTTTRGSTKKSALKKIFNRLGTKH